VILAPLTRSKKVRSHIPHPQPSPAHILS
jgi:hypothetical protein